MKKERLVEDREVVGCMERAIYSNATGLDDW